MRQIAIAISLLLLTAAGSAQDWAKKELDSSPRHQEWVELKSGDRKLKSFVVYPEKKEKATVVVLIHEIMGITDWVMLTADLLARDGFIVIAPDFLSGMGPNGGRTDSFGDVGKVREAISGLSPAQITSDLNAACDYGKTLPAANGKLAVGGFCWGGTQTFAFATKRADLGAALVFYGTGPSDAKALENIKTSVYGFYGSNDARVNATVPASTDLLKKLGKTFEPIEYEGAGHGFMRSGQQPDALPANKQARASAWERMLKILKAI